MATPAVAKPADPVPGTLRTGDRLTQAEFHRIYEQWPEHRKAELIEGVVYVGDTVSPDGHGWPHALASWWLVEYTVERDDLRVYDSSTVLLNAVNEPQPDLCLVRHRPERFDAAGLLIDAPELILEIANTSSAIDLGVKRLAYEQAGVREYIVWRTRERVVDWFRLVDAEFARLEPDARGIIESCEFPGLRLDIEALLQGDRRRLRAALTSI